MDFVRKPTALFSQLTRYGLFGTLLNVGLYVAYLCLTAVHLSPPIASTIVFVLGIPLSLMVHGRLTFRVPGVNTRRKLLFACGYIVGYTVQMGVLIGLYRGLGVPHQLAQLCAIIGVALVLFFYQRHVVFQQ